MFDLKRFLEEKSRGVQRTVGRVSDAVNPLDRQFQQRAQNYFKPTTQLRTRDVVRELPRATLNMRNTVNKGVNDFIVKPFQESAAAASIIPETAWRASVGVGRELAGDKGGFVNEIAQKPYYAEKKLGVTIKPGDANLKSILSDAGNRKIIGKAAELPTYFYAGAKGLGTGIGKPVLSKIVQRSTSVLPEAVLNTGLQQFQQGDMKNLPQNLASNALTMAAFSNIAGGLGDRIKAGKPVAGMSIKDVSKSVGKTPLELSNIAHDNMLKKAGMTQDQWAGLHNDVFNAEREQSRLHKLVGEAFDNAPRDKKGGFTPQGKIQAKKAVDDWGKALDNWTALQNKQRAIKGEPLLPVENVKPTGVGKVDVQPSVAESILGGKTPETPFGFNQSAKGSEFVSPQAKAQLEGASPVRLNTELQDTVAAKLSQMDDVKAHDFAIKTKSDEGTTAAIQLAQKYRKQGNFDLEASLINEKAVRLREAGREVQAAALVDKLSPEGVVSSAAQTIQRYNETAKKPIAELTGAMAEKFSKQAQTIESMADGRDKQLALWNMKQDLLNLVPSTVVDKAVTVWKAGLLTSLRTHERNLLGNTIMSAAEVAKDLPASLVDKALSLATGKRTLTAQVRGLGEFMSKKTRQEISDLVVHGVDLSDDIAKYEVNHVTWADTPIQQGLKKITDAVFRPLGAEDRAFYNAAYARSLYDQAGAAAKNAKDISIVKKLVANPTDDMLLNATKDANYATFHDKNALTKVASGIKKAARSIPGAGGEAGKALTEVLAPFTGVPSSIVGKTLAYSPLGLVKGAVDVGRVLTKDVPGLQRQAAQEVGRGVVGTGLFGLGAYLMGKGLMTGQPKDKKEADLWAAQGKQANSVLVGGKWRSINSIGPQNLVMLAGAKLKEEMDRPDADIGSYLGKLGKDQLSQTFLAGVQGPLNAITDPARYGKSYLGNQGSSVIPNIIKDVSKAFDPLQRENNTIGDYFQNSIPGLRNQNIPKRDVLGQEMKQEPTGINAFIDLFNSKTPKDSATLNELDRLFKAGQEATPASIGKSFKVAGLDFKLDPKQLNELEAQSGNQLVPKLNELVTSESYKSATDEEKKKAIGDVVKAVKDTVKEDYALGSTGTTGATSTTVSTSKVNVDLETAAFERSGKNFMEKDGMVWRKKTDNTAEVLTKDSYEYKLGGAKLAKYKRANDLTGYLKTANSQLDNLEKQISDPNVDELDKVTLEEDYNALLDNMEKYVEYGGFTKPKKGKSKASQIAKMQSLFASDKSRETTNNTYKYLQNLLQPTTSAKTRKVALKKIQGS